MRVQTHNAGVVRSDPKWFKMKTQLAMKATGNHTSSIVVRFTKGFRTPSPIATTFIC